MNQIEKNLKLILTNLNILQNTKRRLNSVNYLIELYRNLSFKSKKECFYILNDAHINPVSIHLSYSIYEQ